MATSKNPYTVARLRREVRDIRLRELGYTSYRQYLRAPHWRAKRVEYAASDDVPKDCICGETEGLQLHHMTYERIGDEALSDLTPLCPTCHQMVHALEARGDLELDFTGFVNEHRAERRRKQVEAQRVAAKVDALMAVAMAEDIRRDWQKVRVPKAGRFLKHRIAKELKIFEQRLAVKAQFR